MTGKPAPCEGKKFGHNIVGPICLECGVGRAELNRQYGPKRVKRPARREKPKATAQVTMHTEAHALAAELSHLCGERKRFGMYLKTVQRIGLAKAYELLSNMKDPKSGIDNPARWFMYKSKLKKKK